MAQGNQLKAWCFTRWLQSEKDIKKNGVNDELVDDEAGVFGKRIIALFETNVVTYFVFQVEKGAEGEGLHIQGYLELAKRMRMTSLTKMFKDKTIHWEKRRGTALQASNYCKAGPDVAGGRYDKYDSFLEMGVISVAEDSTQTKRGRMVKDIKEGKSLNYIQKEHSEAYLAARGGVKELVAAYKQDEDKSDRMPELYIIVGPSGSGKSHLANKMAKELAEEHKLRIAKSVDYDGKHWTGYAGEGIAIYNEFDPQKVPIKQLNLATDKWDYEGRVLFGTQEFNARFWLLTAIDHPETWYQGSGEYGQVFRRVKKIRILKARAEAPVEFDWHSKDEEVDVDM